METTTNTNIALIGAGPIGIEMACALKRAQMPYRHFEAGSLAATIAWYAPGTQIFSSPERIAIAGYPFTTYPQPKSTREDYLEYLREVVYAERLSVELNRKVTTIHQVQDEFKLTIGKSTHGVGGSDLPSRETEEIIETVTAKNIILAIGNMHVGNPLAVPGEHLPHVTHYFKEPHEYFGKRVVIVGAKNSAAEAAARLARMHVDVTVVTRGEGFEVGKIKPWLYPEVISYVKEKRISILPNAKVTSISTDTVTVSSESGVVHIATDHVLLLTGYYQDTSLLQAVGVRLSGPDRTPEIDPDTMQTNIPGVFLIGTASVGTERGHVTSYIETSHVHIPKVLKALGSSAPSPFRVKELRDGETVET